MRATLVRTIALACAISLTAAACGGGTSDADAELAAAIEASAGADGGDFLDGIDIDATCMSEGMVSALGGAEAAEEKYGITVESVESNPELDVEFEQGDAEGLVDALWDCGDMTEIFAVGMTEEGASQEDASCLAENIDEDIIKTTLVAEFMGAAGAALASEVEGQLFDSMLDAMGACDIGLDSFSN